VEQEIGGSIHSSQDSIIVPWIQPITIPQFRNSENVQRNLEIAQIPRLHGTYIYRMVNHIPKLSEVVWMGHSRSPGFTL